MPTLTVPPVRDGRRTSSGRRHCRDGRSRQTRSTGVVLEAGRGERQTPSPRSCRMSAAAPARASRMNPQSRLARRLSTAGQDHPAGPVQARASRNRCPPAGHAGRHEAPGRRPLAGAWAGRHMGGWERRDQGRPRPLIADSRRTGEQRAKGVNSGATGPPQTSDGFMRFLAVAKAPVVVRHGLNNHPCSLLTQNRGVVRIITRKQFCHSAAGRP